jgi:hypothetical protein
MQLLETSTQNPFAKAHFSAGGGFTPYARLVHIQSLLPVSGFVEGINSLGGSGKVSGAMRLLPSALLP